MTTSDFLYFALTNAALLSLTIGVVRRTGARGADAWLYGLVVFGVVAEATTLVLGHWDLASRGPLAGTLSAFALIERFLPRRKASESDRPVELGLLARASSGILLGLLLLWGWRLTAHGTRFSWDDLSYHGTIVAWWLQNDTISYAPYTYQVYYPLGAEIAAFFFSIPTESFAAANLPVLLWMATISAAALVFAKRIGGSPLPAAVAIACVFVSPHIAFFRSTLTANDLAMAAALIAAFAASIHPKEETDRGHSQRALIAGLATGMALGTKPSVAPQVFLLTAWWVVSVFRGKARRSSPVLFLLGSCVLGSYWYMRNWTTTGNPLFPAELGPFEGPLTPVVQHKTSLLYYTDREDFWPKVGRALLDWPYAAGVLLILGYVGAPLIAFRGFWSRRRNEYLPLWACGLLFLCLYPMQPFSGSTNKPLSQFVLLSRYLTFAIAAGFVLAGSWGASSKKGVVAVVTSAFAGLFLASAAQAGLWEVLAPLVGAIMFAALGVTFWKRLSRAPLVTALLVLLVVCATLPHRTQAAVENLYTFTDYWPGWRTRPKTTVRDAWRALNQLPDGQRVGVLSYQASSHVHSLPLMGDRFQHTAVTLHPDGRPRGRLHETWREEPDYWWWEFDQLESVVTPEAFQENLIEADLDYLVISRWPRNHRTPWPESRTPAMMSFSPDKIVWRDGYSMIWKLR